MGKQKNQKTPSATDAYDAFLRDAENASQGTRKSKNAKTRDMSEAYDAAQSVQEPETDAYDAYLAAAMPKRDAKKNNKNKKQPKKAVRGASVGLTVALVLCIGTAGWLGYTRYCAYEDFRHMRAVVEQQTYYEGTRIDGVDVSGMTLAEAKRYWESTVEPRHANVKVDVAGSNSVTSMQLGYASDYESVLETAWNADRSGSLEERYREISKRQTVPKEYKVTRQAYQDGTVDVYVSALASAVNKKAVNAHIEKFDSVNYAFTFAEGSVGRRLDEAAFRKELIAALESGGGSITPKVEEIRPSITLADAESQYGMVAYCVTNASSSAKSRLNNINLALMTINGTCLHPGETFSFNETVGQRTAERGYQKAGAYSSGEVTTAYGGGICQVSTTLFNAVVKADLEIVERHNHSMPVGYIDKGKDATVDWGVQDLKFRNTSDEDIYIGCYLTEDKRVRVGIFGKLLPNGEYITLEAHTVNTLKNKTIYQRNPKLTIGEQRVIQQGYTGYSASAYKCRYAADGTQLSKNWLCDSWYSARDTIIEIPY